MRCPRRDDREGPRRRRQPRPTGDREVRGQRQRAAGVGTDLGARRRGDVGTRLVVVRRGLRGVPVDEGPVHLRREVPRREGPGPIKRVGRAGLAAGVSAHPALEGLRRQVRSGHLDPDGHLVHLSVDEVDRVGRFAAGADLLVGGIAERVLLGHGGPVEGHAEGMRPLALGEQLAHDVLVGEGDAGHDPLGCVALLLSSGGQVDGKDRVAPTDHGRDAVVLELADDVGRLARQRG